jgi:hypothetical protein
MARNDSKGKSATSKAAPEPKAVNSAGDVAQDDSHAAKRVVRDIVGAENAHPGGSNQRRGNVAVKLFAASLLILSTTVAALVFWVNNRLDNALAVQSRIAPAAPSVPSAVPVASGDAAGQLAALQQQMDAWRRDQLSAQKELRESIERVSAAAASAARQPTLPAPASLLDGGGGGAAGVSQTAEMVPQVTPTQKEFIQLKERNRITAYADEAIATGRRKPLETIVEYLRDESTAHLRDAAQAEYMRVQRMIQFYQREDPGYRLPVGELFKDSGLRTEADLTPAQLHQLLADSEKQPWEVRVRAAILLKGSTDAQTDASLIQAMRGDPSLDVVKHAQITFEQRVQRRFRLFDLPAIDSWLESQKKPSAPTDGTLK